MRWEKWPGEGGQRVGRCGRPGKGRGTPGERELGGASCGIPFLTLVVSMKTDPGSGCGCFFRSLPRRLGLLRLPSCEPGQPRNLAGHSLAACPCPDSGYPSGTPAGAREGDRHLPSTSPAPKACSLLGIAFGVEGS